MPRGLPPGAGGGGMGGFGIDRYIIVESVLLTRTKSDVFFTSFTNLSKNSTKNCLQEFNFVKRKLKVKLIGKAS